MIYVFGLSVALFEIGLAGIAADRHLIVMMLAIELIFVSSIIALIAFFSYSQTPNPDAVIMLLSIFAVAASEIIAVITFYVYMKHRGIDFDVTRLSKMKW